MSRGGAPSLVTMMTMTQWRISQYLSGYCERWRSLDDYSLLDVINALDRQRSLSLNAVMSDHGTSVNILDGVSPLLKSLTPETKTHMEFCQVEQYILPQIHSKCLLQHPGGGVTRRLVSVGIHSLIVSLHRVT